MHRLGINRVGHKNLSIRCLRVKETRIARIVFSIGLKDEIATKMGSRIEMLMWVLVLFMILMNYNETFHLLDLFDLCLPNFEEFDFKNNNKRFNSI